jgi:hypothetical protein
MGIKCFFCGCLITEKDEFQYGDGEGRFFCSYNCFYLHDTDELYEQEDLCDGQDV